MMCHILYINVSNKGANKKMNSSGVLKMSEERIDVSLTKDQFKMLNKLLENEFENAKNEEEQQERKKNHNFIQIYRENMPELRWLMANHSFASSILFFILEHMDTKNALACSYAVFEDYFGKSRSTVYRAIKILEDNGFIDLLKVGSSNLYLVNSELAWSDKNDKKQFAKYDGNILISRKENKDFTYRTQFERFKALREREGLKK